MVHVHVHAHVLCVHLCAALCLCLSVWCCLSKPNGPSNQTHRVQMSTSAHQPSLQTRLFFFFFPLLGTRYTPLLFQLQGWPHPPPRLQPSAHAMTGLTRHACLSIDQVSLASRGSCIVELGSPIQLVCRWPGGISY